MTANILVVDDTPANLRLMQNKLKAGFYQVDTARSGEEALGLLEQGRHSIVLLDVMMPGIDGFEVCRLIKANHSSQQVSVIMITSLNDMESRIKGLEAGADDFISRPVQDEILFARIQSLERLNALMQQVNLRTQTTKKLGYQTDIPNLGDIDFAHARLLLCEPDMLVRDTIKQNLTEDLNAIVQTETLENAQNLTAKFELFITNADHQHESDGIRQAISFSSQADTRNIPTVLLFDDSNDPRAKAALLAGVSDYMPTEVNRSELIARIKTQLKRHRHLKHLEKLYETAINTALTDSLTGLYSRRYASQHLPELVKQTQKSGDPLALLIIDADDFKNINDKYGHAAGDLMLKTVANCLKNNMRDVDLLARWGGDEFVAVMPDCDLETAQRISSQLNTAVEAIGLNYDGQKIPVTVSIGGSTTSTFVEMDTDWLDLLRQADKALYDAKARHKGRAKIV